MNASEMVGALKASGEDRRALIAKHVERLCTEAELEQRSGNERVANLLWQIAEEFERDEI